MRSSRMDAVDRPAASRVGEAVAWLSAFYSGHCDDAWEHQYGVTIQTIDNPGWTIEVDLTGTEFAASEFVSIDNGTDVESADWYVVFGRDGKLRGAGSPDRLGTLLVLLVEAMQSVEREREP